VLGILTKCRILNLRMRRDWFVPRFGALLCIYSIPFKSTVLSRVPTWVTGYYYGLKGHFRCPRNGLPGSRRKSFQTAQILPRRFHWRLAEPQPPQPPSSKHQLMCNYTIPGDDCLPHSIVNIESHANRSRSDMDIPLWDVTTRAILD